MVERVVPNRRQKCCDSNRCSIILWGMAVALDDLDATGTLALVDEVLLGRRAAEVDDLRLGAHWADLHAADPRLGPEGRRRFAPGGDRLVEVGGEDTPLVQDLCFAEL